MAPLAQATPGDGFWGEGSKVPKPLRKIGKIDQQAFGLFRKHALRRTTSRSTDKGFVGEVFNGTVWFQRQLCLGDGFIPLKDAGFFFRGGCPVEDFHTKDWTRLQTGTPDFSSSVHCWLLPTKLWVSIICFACKKNGATQQSTARTDAPTDHG